MKNIIKKIYNKLPIKMRKFIKENLQRLRMIDYIILYKIYRINKLDNKKVLFLSSSRDSLSGNLEYIYDELIKYDYEINMYLDKKINVKKSFKQKKE